MYDVTVTCLTVLLLRFEKKNAPCVDSMKRFMTWFCCCILAKMDLIIASPDGTVSSMDALHVAPDLEKKMAITHAEKLIRKLVKDNWMSEASV